MGRNVLRNSVAAGVLHQQEEAMCNMIKMPVLARLNFSQKIYSVSNNIVFAAICITRIDCTEH